MLMKMKRNTAIVLARIKLGLQNFAMWLVVDSPIRLGRLAPHVFGFAIGRKPVKVKYDKTDMC